jgi:hypothetical protein
VAFGLAVAGKAADAELVTAFPDTLDGLDGLTTWATSEPDGVEAWADSLFNACVPLSTADHSGVLPEAAGEHHYPWPVKSADYFRYDDFELRVRLPDDTDAAVTPVDRRGSGDGHVRVVHAWHGTPAGGAPWRRRGGVA